MTLCDLSVTAKLDRKWRQLLVYDLHINIHTYIYKNNLELTIYTISTFRRIPFYHASEALTAVLQTKKESKGRGQRRDYYISGFDVLVLFAFFIQEMLEHQEFWASRILDWEWKWFANSPFMVWKKTFLRDFRLGGSTNLPSVFPLVGPTSFSVLKIGFLKIFFFFFFFSEMWRTFIWLMVTCCHQESWYIIRKNFLKM